MRFDGGGAWFAQNHSLNGVGGTQSVRNVLRFDRKIRGEDVPSVPARYRGLNGPQGTLIGVRLRPATNEVWLRLLRRRSGARLPWSREIWTVALSATQPPAPTPDSVELLKGMHVYCHEGYIGQMEGITIDPRTGGATELLMHVRGDVLADVDLPTSPFARLLPLSGQHVLLSPTWATTTKPEPAALPFMPPQLALHLDATAEQIASCSILRRDQDLAADIWRILSANPALAPYTAGIHLNVRDGDVTIEGRVPSARHRASIEQDIWHVPGIYALHDELRVTGH